MNGTVNEKAPERRTACREATPEDLTCGLYDDIIGLPHPVSKKHPPMPLAAPAAQFAPFAALTGHSDAVHETERQQVYDMENLLDRSETF